MICRGSHGFLLVWVSSPTRIPGLPLSFYTIFVILPLLFLTASFSVVFFVINQQREQQARKERLAVLPQREIVDPTFTKDGYIKPLEKNDEGSIYSARASVRGKVKEWQNGKVQVWVGATLREIKLPNEVNLRCFSEYIVNKSGEKMKTSDAWLDVNNMAESGPKVKSVTLPQWFAEGADIVLAVNVGKNDSMTAYQVVGYGCKETP
jgi:hypothetical protein